MAWSELLPEAEDEYLDAVTYCERRQPGTGARFRIELLATLDRIRNAPRMYRVVYQPDIRQAPMGRRFPYPVYFREIEGEIEIIAVSHDSQRPGYWLDRV